jgi:hypothetical protein
MKGAGPPRQVLRSGHDQRLAPVAAVALGRMQMPFPATRVSYADDVTAPHPWPLRGAVLKDWPAVHMPVLLAFHSKSSPSFASTAIGHSGSQSSGRDM